MVERIEGEDICPRPLVGDEPAGQPPVGIDAADQLIEIILGALRHTGPYPNRVWYIAIEVSIGSDSSTLTRDAMPAMRADLALVSASASTMPSARFWFGQITPQTLRNMISAR